MERLPYFVMAGSVLLALGTAVIAGGTYWIVPAIIVPVVAVYFLFDRFYLKPRESPEERLAAEEDPA
jgi:hypothetical protein